MFLRKYKIILTSLISVLVLTSSAFGLLDNWSHWRRGLMFLKNKNFIAAENNFNYYLKHPEMHRHMFGVAYFGRGLLYQERGNYGQAIKEYKLAIQNDLHPTVKLTGKAYMNIGTIYMKRKAYNNAIEAYSKAVENNQNNGLAHYYLGLAYSKTGEYEKAEKESEEAKRLGITFTTLSDNLSKIKNNPSKSSKTNKTNQTNTTD